MPGSSLKDILWGGPRKQTPSFVSPGAGERITKPLRSICFQPKHADNCSRITSFGHSVKEFWELWEVQTLH